MQELVPHLVDTLKLKKQWEKPNYCLLKSINAAEVISSDNNDDNEHALSVSHHAAQENTMEAVCNLITDVSMDAIAMDQPTASTCTSSLLKDLQPHKEKPSKGRRRRFHCLALHGDQAIPSNHDVFLFNF